MTQEELVKKINENFLAKEAYRNGTLKSKTYTEEEIEAKRQYFLSKVPPDLDECSIGRWHYEIKRVFELSKSFRKCPDLWFYHLEHYFDF